MKYTIPSFVEYSFTVFHRFHVVLLGVCPSGCTHVIFNPGIDYVMKNDDTCYYISETQEEYSDYQIVKPTCFQEGLWNASANIGLLSMYIVGIDPEKFVTPDDEDVDGHKNVILKRMVSMQSERKLSVESIEHSPKKSSLESHPLHQEDDIGSLDPQITAEVCNWQEEANLGVQLLNYHGKNREKKPVVKLSVVPKACQRRASVPATCENPLSGLSVPTCHNPLTDFRAHVDLEPISEDLIAPEIVVIDTLTDEEDVKMKEQLIERPKPHSQPAVLHYLNRSTSHVEQHTSQSEAHTFHHGSELTRKSSSIFRLNLHKTDTGKFDVYVV